MHGNNQTHKELHLSNEATAKGSHLSNEATE